MPELETFSRPPLSSIMPGVISRPSGAKIRSAGSRPDRRSRRIDALTRRAPSGTSTPTVAAFPEGTVPEAVPVSSLFAAVLAAGGAVRELVEHRRTLEEVFLGAVQSAGEQE